MQYKIYPGNAYPLGATWDGNGTNFALFADNATSVALCLFNNNQFVNDRSLVEKGLTNYWGYNTIGFFAPDVRYSLSGVCGEQVTEFKSMVKELHKACYRGYPGCCL